MFDTPDIDTHCTTLYDGIKVRGGYWCAGYVWEKCILPLKMNNTNLDFAHNVRDIENGNVCVLRSNVKNGIFMS
jgi:hypothetical protein